MSTAVPRLPPAHVDQVTGNRRVAETINNILGFQHDDSRIRTAAEVAAGVTPVNYAYAPGDVRRYGAKWDGVTDDHAALVAAYLQATQANGAPVFWPPGVGLCASQFSTGANVLTCGVGKGASILRKGFNGDLIIWGSGSGFRDVQIDGNSGSFTGRSATIAASTNGQYSDSCEWIRSSGYHVEYLGQDPGSNSYFISCDFSPTLIPANGVAIKYSGTTDSQAIPRSIINCHGGGAYLVDFGAANDSFFIGNFTNGMVWSSANVSHVFALGNRIALNGATLTVKGGETILLGNSIAGPIVFDATTAGCMFLSNPGTGWDSITDSGAGNYIDIKQVGYTPTWVSSGGGASLGNATVAAQWSRTGNTVCVDIDILIGSTTNFGTGTIQIGLPSSPSSFSQFVVGIAYLNDASTGTNTIAAAISNPALSYLNLQANGTTGAVSGTVPWTWATGDRITLHAQYSTP